MLTIVNGAAVNTGAACIFSNYIFLIMYLFCLSFLDICPGVGLLDHMVALVLVFKGTSILFSVVAAPIYIPTNSVGVSRCF